jgi:hypothetical protein
MKKTLLTIIALSGLFTTSFAQIPSYVPTNGMIGWWPFDGNANDLSPNGNDGTVYGAVLSPDRFGAPNMAYSFDGIDDYIDCNRTYQATFSFSIWFKTFADEGYSPIIDAYDGHWEIQLKNNQPDYVSFVTTTNYQEFISANTVTGNVWHHLVCTYDAGAVNFFIDGQLTDQFNVLVLQVFDGTYNFGASLSGTDQYLNGTLDDIGLWNRVVTEEEVTSLYNGEICEATIATAGPTFFCEGEELQLTANEADSYLWSNNETTQSITVTEGDDYTVTVTINGCQATSEVTTISMNPAPTVTLAPIAALCENAGKLSLQGGSPAGGTYTLNGTLAMELNPTSTGSGQQTVVYSYADGNGCVGSATQFVTINAVPVVTLTGLASGYLPTDGDVQLTGSPMGGVYNGLGVSGSTFSPTTAGLGTHGVSYAVVNGSGCIGVSALCTTVDLTTGGGSGIGVDNGGSGVEIYPNPANGLYNVMLEQMEGIVTAKVYDAQGREVWANAIVANGTRSQHSIDLSTQAKGIYTLQLQTTQGTITRKLVKN